MRTFLATCCLALGLSSAWAADPYPTKPITLIVPQAPGGANDIVGRALAQRLPWRWVNPWWSRTSPAQAATWAPPWPLVHPRTATP